MNHVEKNTNDGDKCPFSPPSPSALKYALVIQFYLYAKIKYTNFVHTQHARLVVKDRDDVFPTLCSAGRIIYPHVLR